MGDLVSGEKYMTGSSVIVVTRCLINVCKKIKEADAFTNFCEPVKEVLAQLEKGLNDRFKNIEHSKTFALCTFLDPRYKTGVFSDSTAARKAKTNVIEMVSEIINKNSKFASAPVVSSEPVSENLGTAPAGDRPTSASTSTLVKTWDIFKEILSDQNVQDRSTPLSRAIKEVDTYLADDILPLKDESGKINSQLEWWEKHQHVYPNMSKIFKSKCNISAM